MTIQIKALARKNPRDIAAAPKYHATKVNQGEVSLKKLSKNSLSNLTPHPAYVFMHYSHPTLLERVRNLKK